MFSWQAKQKNPVQFHPLTVTNAALHSFDRATHSECHGKSRSCLGGSRGSNRTTWIQRGSWGKFPKQKRWGFLSESEQRSQQHPLLQHASFIQVSALHLLCARLCLWVRMKQTQLGEIRANCGEWFAVLFRHLIFFPLSLLSFAVNSAWGSDKWVARPRVKAHAAAQITYRSSSAFPPVRTQLWNYWRWAECWCP